MLYAISADPPEQTRAFVKKIEADGKRTAGFTFLSDPDHTVIDRYALRDPAYAGTDHEGIPHPAVFVLDHEGVVRWSRIETDYTKRPAVAEIQSAIDAVSRSE